MSRPSTSGARETPPRSTRSGSQFQSPFRPNMSRQAWPWSSSGTRPGSSASFRGSFSSASTLNQTAGWAGAPGVSPTNTRQWSFGAFEWAIDNVASLRDYVENPPSTTSPEHASVEITSERSGPDEDETLHYVFNEAPILGDGRFMLEIARTITPEQIEETTAQTHPPTLSINISPAIQNYETAATLMVAIKALESKAGERSARADWVWEHWGQFTFCKNSEVWECELPPLSTLLENPRISASDKLVLCIQIHSPVGPMFPQHPSAFYVPRDLLEGLEASLDNSHTGDVRFICVERLPSGSSSPTALSQRTSESPTSFASRHQLVRKRIIYAHSDILKRRSEYFSNMLSSTFAESGTAHLAPGERRVHDVVVEDADFVTMYWVLKYIYANYLLFREEDDPREAVGLAKGLSAHWLARGDGRNEWEATTLLLGSPNGFEDGSDGASTEGPPASAASVKETPLSTPVAKSTTSTSTRRLNTMSGTTASSSRQVPSTSSGTFSSQQARAPSTPPRPSRSAGKSRAGFQPNSDPHPHPTPSPPPASALAIYLVAHRYNLEGLVSLAMEHTMNHVTPRTALPLLLATSYWEELRALLEDYVVARWEEVSSSSEFDVCCEEIAAGEWGALEGGATLSALFRRLHRPGVVQH